MNESVTPTIALAGNPNCGKTALFNALTGSRQKVANYPGVTVEKKSGQFQSEDGARFKIIDLPGCYSLDARSPDEEVTRDLLLNRFRSERDFPNILIVVVDATQLRRHLSLVLELQRIGKPIVVALNMMDLAKKQRIQIDVSKLSSILKVPVIETVATSREGLENLQKKVIEVASNLKVTLNQEISWKYDTIQEIRSRFEKVDFLIQSAVKTIQNQVTFTEKLDRILLHPVLGLGILGLTMIGIFQAVFTWATPFQGWIDKGFVFFGSQVMSLVPEGVLRDLLVDGVIAGIGGIVIFLPQIIFLFLFILILEDLGYMARAAFLLDRVMGRVGLHGRSFVPLLSSFACAIPGIMATRTIENRRDRIITIMVTPLMTCSAQIPVYALLISAFIPNWVIFGPVRLQGLVMFGLYLSGIVFALLFATLMKKTFLRGSQPALILEMPSYKWPSWRNVLQGLSQRAVFFLRRAGTIILSLTMLLWFLASYPKYDLEQSAASDVNPPIYYSYAGQMGRAIEPLLRPLGFDWRISVALIPGFAAREVMVSGLATVYAVEAEESQLEEKLGGRLAQSWSLATALALLVWYIFSPQCISTLAIVKRETNSWKWAGFMLVYLLSAAYFFTWISSRGFLALGWG